MNYLGTYLLVPWNKTHGEDGHLHPKNDQILQAECRKGLKIKPPICSIAFIAISADSKKKPPSLSIKES